MPRAEPGSVSELPLGRAGQKRPLARRRVGLAGRLGQTPVDHQRLAVLAHDHVARLDVAVQHPARVGVADRVAHVHEPPQELAQLQRPAARIFLERLVAVEVPDRFLERLTADEPHGVIGPAVAVGAQAVDRHDAGVLQPAGDLGLEHEAAAAGGVVGVRVEDLLDGDLAVQFAVEGDEHGAQAAFRMRPQDTEALAVGSGRADATRSRCGRRRRTRSTDADADAGESFLDLAVAECARPSRVVRPAGIAARLFSVLPPCFFSWRPTITSTAARWSASRSPRSTR